MDFNHFVRLAKKYSNMGSAVQQQMDDVMDGGEALEDLNPNALKMILELVEAFDRVTEGGDEDSFHVKHTIKEHLRIE